MTDDTPRFSLIAGPNGAGKTTFAREYLPHIVGTFNFLNSDLIAAGLAPLAPETAAIRAGRLLIQEFDALAARRQTFAVESTISGSWLLPRIDKLVGAGYRCELYYLWVASEDLAVGRVRERVRDGGHDVPDTDIRRRFRTSLERLKRDYLERFHAVYLFDNTGIPAREIARHEHGSWHATDPIQLRRVMGDLE